MGTFRSIGKVIVKNAGAMIIGGALFSVLDKLSKNLDRSKAVKELQRNYEWLSSDLTRVEHDVDVLSRKVEYLEEDEEDFDEILTEHLQHGRIVERLRVADHA